MKKNLPGLLLGLLIGAIATWFFVRGHQSAAPAEAPAATTDEEPDEEGLKLTKAEQDSAGLKIAQPETFAWRPEIKGYARVLDPAPLIELTTEISAAQATLQASDKEYERQKLLRAGDNASAKTLETAEAAWKRDQTTLESAQARLLTTWGKAIAEAPNLDSLIHTLLAQEAALVRVDFPPGIKLPTTAMQVRLSSLTDGDTSLDASIIGPAPSADAQLQGPGLLALLTKSLPPNTALVAWVSGNETPQSGVRIPSSAVVFEDGVPFVYLQTSLDDKTGELGFDRRKIQLGPTVSGGVFVPNGLTPQDKVVVTGAQQLLSQEIKLAGGGGGGD